MKELYFIIGLIVFYFIIRIVFTIERIGLRRFLFIIGMFFYLLFFAYCFAKGDGVVITVFTIAIIVLYKLYPNIKQYLNKKKFEETSYHKATGKTYEEVLHDSGTIGEYHLYNKLLPYQERGAKFLHNIYIPKEDGKTTEIDLMMLTQKGVFVYESKNYSGWIFGGKDQHMWTQTLPTGNGKSRKEFFLSPIIQNQNHIKHFEKIIGEIESTSIIVFSDFCEFKTMWQGDDKTRIVHLRDVLSVTNELYEKSDLFFPDDVLNNIYERLLPYTNVSDEVKKNHIDAIKK